MGESIVSNENIRPVVTRILALSATVFFFLLWLLFFRTGPEPDPGALSFLPATNAALNGLAATCIICGFVAIKSGRRRLHMTFMITAVCLSVIFLVSYITYHTIHARCSRCRSSCPPCSSRQRSGSTYIKKW